MKGGLFDLCNLVYREENILPEKFKINCDGDGWRSPVAAGKVRRQALFSILEFKMVSQITKLIKIRNPVPYKNRVRAGFEQRFWVGYTS